MKKTQILAVAVVGLAGAALWLEISEPKAIHAAVATLVNVVNTPNVAVTSMPAVQLNGGTSVSVTDGTDAAGHPVLFTGGSEPRNSFTATGYCSTFGNFGCHAALYTAPANDIAVVQSFSGQCQLTSTGDGLYDATLLTPETLKGYFATLTPPVQVPVGPYLVPMTAVSFNGNTTYYLQPGQELLATADAVQELSGTSTGNCEFMVFGYLVPQ